MKSAIFFILGAALGATGAAFITKYICDAKAEQKIADATVEARDYYKKKYDMETEDLNKKIDEEAHKKIANVYQSYQNENRVFGNTFKSVTEAFNKLKEGGENPKGDELLDYITEINYREHPVDSDGNKTYLYIIDPDEAGMDDDFTQYALDYYQDGVLVDEQGNIVDNPLDIVGDFTDELSLENPEIYVRNDVTKTEYDICYIAASYEQPGGECD